QRKRGEQFRDAAAVERGADMHDVGGRNMLGFREYALRRLRADQGRIILERGEAQSRGGVIRRSLHPDLRKHPWTSVRDRVPCTVSRNELSSRSHEACSAACGRVGKTTFTRRSSDLHTGPVDRGRGFAAENDAG